MNGAKSSNKAKNQTPLRQKTCDKTVVYNCNVHQADSHTNQAIKQLEKIMENLTAIFSETSTSQPKPSGPSCSKDSAIHRINHYPVDSTVGFTNAYPVDSVIHLLNNRGQV